MTSPQAKQSKMDEAETQKLIEQIDQVQTHLDRLNEMASEEILKVEIKYNKQRQPHHQKRSELIAKLPQFWITVFLNHPQLSSIIEHDDEAVLYHLKSLEIEDSEDIRSGYSIKLAFENNPYFENEVLIKEFNISEACEATSKCTTIKWKPGKNFTDKEQSSFGSYSRKRNRLNGVGFFAWFQDSTDAGADEIGEIIKDDIFINPLQYYLVETVAPIDDDQLLVAGSGVVNNAVNSLHQQGGGNGAVGPDGYGGVEEEDELDDLDEEDDDDEDEDEDEEDEEEDGPPGARDEDYSSSGIGGDGQNSANTDEHAEESNPTAHDDQGC